MNIIKMLLISLLTLYAPLELTRVIIDWEGFSGNSKFIFEICFIWFFFVIALFVIYRLIARKQQVN